MDLVAGSKNDEYYTPTYAVNPLLKYLKPHSEIWCPFDTEESNFVKILREEGHEVKATHITTGCDFFTIKDADFDYIISNPPYSVKGKVLDRLFELGRPFAMLVGSVGLFESQHRFNMFKNNDFEMLYLNKRVSYIKDYKKPTEFTNPPFSSVYVCSGILPKQIVFEQINKADFRVVKENSKKD